VKLLDERQQVMEAITNFPKMWGMGSYPADRRGRMVGEELSKLDPNTATAEDVAEIIGNSAWARPNTCSECGRESWNIVEIGEPPDNESRTAHLCATCLTEGAKLASPPSTPKQGEGE
jgi:hypothetical protein